MYEKIRTYTSALLSAQDTYTRMRLQRTTYSSGHFGQTTFVAKQENQEIQGHLVIYLIYVKGQTL
jgi:hypothetical protein